MSKISYYPSADEPLQLSDRLIGTEAPRIPASPTPLATKNFSLSELLDLFSSNFPAASLQAVLNTGNTATQNITLVGTITSTVMKPTNIEDTSGSQGVTFQVLSKGASSINWVNMPVDNLQAVLNAGSTATGNITLVGDITSTKIIPGNIQDDTAGIGTVGQVLSKTASGIRWITNPASYTAGLADVLSVGNTATNNINLIGNITATSFIKSGGTSLQFLMADGSVSTGPSITGYVPYTGATEDVDLGEFEIKAGQVEFDQTPTGTAGVGVMRWNDSDGTVDLGLKGGNVTLQVGQEQVLRVVNKTATNINLLEANYQAVRVTGAQGQRLKVDLAQAINDTLSAETIGLVTETINNNQEGFITTSGLVRGINTTGSLQGETWADGDILYLSPTTAGNATKVKPVAPNHLIILGYVIRAHINQGSIFVKVDNGYELDELHNVKITSAANNNVLAYTSATDIWENKTVETALGYTPFQLPALTSGSVLFSNGTTIAQNNTNLFWNNTNNRLGIGTSSPTTTLDVSGTTRIGGSLAAALTVERTTANSNIYIQYKNASTSWYAGQTDQGKFGIGTNAALGASTIFNISSSGNLLLNTTTDAGFKLDVNGTARVSGTTTITPAALTGAAVTSALDIAQTWNTTGTPSAIKLNVTDTASNGSSFLLDLRVANTQLFGVTKSGFITFGGAFGSTGALIGTSAGTLNFYHKNTTAAAYGFDFRPNSGAITATSSESGLISLRQTFSPTSGTGIFNAINLSSNLIINQTGTANGITRGLYINPTLTAAADFRAIETTVGNVLFGASGTGFFWNNTNNRLGIGTAAPISELSVASISGITLQSGAIMPNLHRDNTDGAFLIRSYSTGTSTYTTNVKVRPNGNFLIGTTTDAGYKLDVNGTARCTTIDTNIVKKNAANGGVIVRFTGTNDLVTYGLRVENASQGNVYNATTGTFDLVDLKLTTFNPTSGTGVFNSINIGNTINQTGTATGITRGLYINPILTSAADFRAIETTNGKVIFGNLPTSATGLPTGAIWNDSGTIKIV